MNTRRKNIRQVPVEATFKLRQSILRQGLPLSHCRLPHDHAPGVIHYAAFRNRLQVGIASVYPIAHASEPLSWQLRAMATLPWVRRQHYGQALLLAAEVDVRKHGGKAIWCYARTNAVGFYEKSGFVVKGSWFMIPRVGPHYLMVKPL